MYIDNAQRFKGQAKICQLLCMAKPRV